MSKVRTTDAADRCIELQSKCSSSILGELTLDDQSNDLRLAAFLLGATERESGDVQVDENLLALLELNALAPMEREELDRQLAASPRGRRIANLGLMHQENSVVRRRPKFGRILVAGIGLAAAACLALLISPQFVASHRKRIDNARVEFRKGDLDTAKGMLQRLLSERLNESDAEEAQQLLSDVFVDQTECLLIAGRFNEVRTNVNDAQRLKVNDPRLINLHSQAIRGMSGPKAVAFAGRLDQFGELLQAPGAKSMGPSGFASEEDQRAFEMLDGIVGSEGAPLEARLNHAHLLLSVNAGKSRALFEQMNAQEKGNVDILTGLGLAQFLTGDFEAAAATFTTILKSRANDISARVNLAFALEESREDAAAMSQWQSVLEDPQLKPEDRANIANRLRILKLRTGVSQGQRSTC